MRTIDVQEPQKPLGPPIRPAPVPEKPQPTNRQGILVSSNGQLSTDLPMPTAWVESLEKMNLIIHTMYGQPAQMVLVETPFGAWYEDTPP